MTTQPRTKYGQYISRKAQVNQYAKHFAAGALAGFVTIVPLLGAFGLLTPVYTFVSPVADHQLRQLQDYSIINVIHAKEPEEVAASSVLSMDEATSSAGFTEIINPKHPTEQTKENVDAYMKQVFGKDFATAWAVSMVEGYPKTEPLDWGRSYCWYKFENGKHKGEYSVGPFQINIVEGCNGEGDKVHWAKIPGNTLQEKIDWLSNPFNNIDLGYQIYKDNKGFGPWTGFTSGNYLKHMN